MYRMIKRILFATDLTANCKPAFDYAATLATRYQATIVLLHVIEKMPDYVEGRLKGLLGREQWRQMSESHRKDAFETLTGKRPSNRLIRAALDQFCADSGIDDNACGYKSKEIVIGDGDTVDEIVSTSKEYDCDIIVMGAKQAFMSEKTSIGPVIKGVLRRSKLPVMVVPADTEPAVEEEDPQD